MVSESQKVTLTELAAAGYITHEVLNFFTKSKLQTAEINAFLRVMKKAVPWVARTVGRGLARVPGTARMIAMRHPYIATAGVIYLAYENREEIQNLLARGYVIATDPSFGQPGAPGPFGETFRPGPAIVTIPPAVTKGAGRAVSKANKAVKQAMGWLKEGTKAATGAKPGTYPKKAWEIATKAAGKANPNTPSIIGKGKSLINKIARRLKKWW